MLTWLGRAGQSWAKTTPWTNVYGVSRTLLALATAGTLISSSTDTLFRPALTLPPAPYCAGFAQISLFCAVPREQLWFVQWLAVGMLLLVATGWRPWLTAVPHWWVSFGLSVSTTIPDGGDQVTAVLTLLLLPVALTDPRRWHWESLPEGATAGRAEVARLVALFGLLAVRVQVAGIYFHSSIAKLGVAEWVDGTALYYWLLDPAFGAPGWLRGPIMPIVAHPVGVVALTWGTFILEFCLALGLILNKRFWTYLLPLGVVFHALIAVTMGLVSFSTAMIAALIVYLQPIERGFTFAPPLRLIGRFRSSDGRRFGRFVRAEGRPLPEAAPK